MSGIAVVIPTLNAETYLDHALRSVFAQPEAREVVAVDGGSTDATLAILARYDRVRVIEHAGNQAAAINVGAAATGGEVLGFLNGDDAYAPGAFARVLDAFARATREVGVVVGGARIVDAHGETLRHVSGESVDATVLARRCPIVQPAAFVRREAFVGVGGMNVARPYACDYDLWVRLARECRFLTIDEELAESRDHADNKSSRSRTRVHAEVDAILRDGFGYVPFPWVYGSVRARFPTAPRALTVAAALPVGLVRNPNAPLRYGRDWLRHRRLGGAR